MKTDVEMRRKKNMVRRMATQSYAESAVERIHSVVDTLVQTTQARKINLTYNRFVAMLYASVAIALAGISLTSAWWRIASRLIVSPDISSESATYDLIVDFGITGANFKTNFPSNFTSQLVDDIANGTAVFQFVEGSTDGYAVFRQPDLDVIFGDLFIITSSQIGAASALFILLAFTATQFVHVVRSTLASAILKIIPAGLVGTGIVATVYLSSIANASNEFICNQFVYLYENITISFVDYCNASDLWSGSSVTRVVDGVTFDFLLSSNPNLGWWMQVVMLILGFALTLMTLFGSDDLLGYENQYTVALIDEDRSKEIARKILEILANEKQDNQAQVMLREAPLLQARNPSNDEKSVEG